MQTELHNSNRVNHVQWYESSGNRAKQYLPSDSVYAKFHSIHWVTNVDRVQTTWKWSIWTILICLQRAWQCRVLIVDIKYQNLTKLVFRTRVVVVGLTLCILCKFIVYPTPLLWKLNGIYVMYCISLMNVEYMQMCVTMWRKVQ